MKDTQFIGMDVHKLSISVAIVGEHRDSIVRFLGNIENTPDSLNKLCKKLEKNSGSLDFCYEAGCCGYGIYRQLIDAGHSCLVAAPSRIPKAPGDTGQSHEQF